MDGVPDDNSHFFEKLLAEYASSMKTHVEQTSEKRGSHNSQKRKNRSQVGTSASPVSDALFRSLINDKEESEFVAKNSAYEHDARMDYEINELLIRPFFDAMRIRYASGIYALILFWLLCVFGLMLSYACGGLDLRVIAIIIGAFVGVCMSMKLNHVFHRVLAIYGCRNRFTKCIGFLMCHHMRDDEIVNETAEVDKKLSADGAQNGENVNVGVERSHVSETIRKNTRAEKKYINVLQTYYNCSGDTHVFLITIPLCIGATLAVVYASCGEKSFYLPCQIDPSVLKIILGSTSLSVIGLFAAVLYWLYPRKYEKAHTSHRPKRR